jgi:hypothetical protein
MAWDLPPWYGCSRTGATIPHSGCSYLRNRAGSWFWPSPDNRMASSSSVARSMATDAAHSIECRPWTEPGPSREGPRRVLTAHRGRLEAGQSDACGNSPRSRVRAIGADRRSLASLFPGRSCARSTFVTLWKSWLGTPRVFGGITPRSTPYHNRPFHPYGLAPPGWSGSRTASRPPARARLSDGTTDPANRSWPRCNPASRSK